MSAYVDVHTHLTHAAFEQDQDLVIKRAEDSGLGAVVVNGLEPKSNREILKMRSKSPIIKAALGIYPIDAVNDRLPSDFPLDIEAFDVEEEIRFIEEQAKSGALIGIGECGLDGHWLNDETFSRQEYVFEQLLDIAMKYDLPAIIHTRKREKRSMEILRHLGVRKVNFHCYGGKSKLALQAAEKEGWFFSIPANAKVNQLFTKLLRELPEDQILTETDAPYLSPDRNTRNEPANVVHTVSLLAKLKNWDVAEAKLKIWNNYQQLFG